MVDRKRSDAQVSYAAEWQTLKLGNNLGDFDVALEDANEVFSWGDTSKFAFQVSENERYGFAFITRKDHKVYFIDAWGLLLEDPEEISAFLTPKLELFDAEPYFSESSSLTSLIVKSISSSLMVKGGVKERTFPSGPSARMRRPFCKRRPR
jgi:hypothetical protein